MMNFPDFVAIAADIKSAAAELKAGHTASQSTLEDIATTLHLMLDEMRVMHKRLRSSTTGGFLND